MSMQSGAVRMT